MSIYRLNILGLVLLLSSCVGKHLDPAGEAQSKNSITDAQVASLQEPIQLEEIQQMWGPSEGQPGPRITYKAADHDGQYFWVYYSRPEKDPASDVWIIERIIRADRIEEGGVVVWPTRLQDKDNKGKQDTPSNGGQRPTFNSDFLPRRR
jgi:hypothetical protein